jgi:hypothetical protein
MQSKLYLFIHQNIFPLLKCIKIDLGKTFKFGKIKIFSKFRICVGKFQIEAGHHRKIQRQGRVCINDIDYECHFL